MAVQFKDMPEYETRLNCTAESLEIAHWRTECERLRKALEKILLCDDDGYGPDGYCANIAKAALEE